MSHHSTLGLLTNHLEITILREVIERERDLIFRTEVWQKEDDKKYQGKIRKPLSSMNLCQKCVSIAGTNLTLTYFILPTQDHRLTSLQLTEKCTIWA